MGVNSIVFQVAPAAQAAPIQAPRTNLVGRQILRRRRLATYRQIQRRHVQHVQAARVLPIGEVDQCDS